jgi:hypothetical protein
LALEASLRAKLSSPKTCPKPLGEEWNHVEEVDGFRSFGGPAPGGVWWRGNQASPPPGDQLNVAEDSVNTQAAALLNDAIAAFSDVLPAGLAPQATNTEPPPLTLAYNGEETVLIGGPWRPPFPWPLPNGADDLNGKPLFITIKTRSGPRPPKAHVGRLQKNARGEWEVAWYGERGAPPEVLPATVEQVGQFEGAPGKIITS